MSSGQPFGLWLKQRRHALDLTQHDLARSSGFSVSMLQKLELGKRRPSKEVAMRLAEVLEIPLEERATIVGIARVAAQAGRTSPISRADDRLEPGSRSRREALPVSLTPLIGRAHEVAALSTSLEHDSVRLHTLVGPGGTGKTRLALEVAAEAQSAFADGVCFVALAALTDPALVVTAIGQALDLRQFDGQPPLAALTDYLRPRHLLLVHDNFEQLLPAASIVATMLAAGPTVKGLVTRSRQLRASHWYSAAFLAGHGAVLLAEGQAERATRLFAAIAAPLLVSADPDVERNVRTDYDSDVAAVRARLPPALFAAAWAEGRAMTLEQVLASIDSAGFH